MKHPTNLFTVLPYDQEQVLLQVIGAAGKFQIPIEKEQAAILAKQLLNFVQGSEDSMEERLKDYVRDSMIRLPKGQLWMGSMPNDDIPEDELPRHPVMVNSFEMSAFLVTQGLWRYVMGSNPSLDKGGRKAVHNITWLDAIGFCNELSKMLDLTPVYDMAGEAVSWNTEADGFRLPTEVEWEYAARTRDDLRFSGSDRIQEVGWTKEMCSDMPEIAQKKSNLWGFHDLSGLLWEWCWDDFVPYQSDASKVESREKVCRGGSWKSEPTYARCTARYSQPLTFKGDIGLRVVRTLK